MKEAIFVNRQTGAAAIPLRFPDGWYLLTLAGLGPREVWPKGIRQVKRAIAKGELPGLDVVRALSVSSPA